MSRLPRRLAAVVVAVAAAACATGRDTPPEVITLAVTSSPNNLDPRIGTDEVSQKTQQLIFSTLLALNDRRLQRADSGEHPHDGSGSGASIIGQQTRMLLCDMQYDRP